MKQPTRLFDFPYFQQEHYPLAAMMTSKINDKWVTISTNEFIQQMNSASRGLIALDIKIGDKIALITHGNRSEWDIMDNAIMQIGAVDVPIYPSMTAADCEFILNHAEVKYCFVSNEELFKKIDGIRDQVPSLKNIYTFDKVNGASQWTEIFAAGAEISQASVDALSAQVKETDMATIIYTSGTTGLPKGVMLSHLNIASNALDCEERLPAMTKSESRALSFLPISHVYERMLHYLYMANGVHIYLSGMETIKDDLMVAQPHIFTGVPRLFEKFYDGILAKGMLNSGLKLKIFRWAHDLAIRWEPDNGNGFFYELQLKLARKLVFSKVKLALGLTEIRGVASGSAALQQRLARFFNGAGIWVLEGYGLTETSPVISVNTLSRPHMWRAGTVGKPIKRVEVKIAEDGEILTKGPNVMLGYYKDEERTREVIKDGWFCTGDIGMIKDEFIYITDRKKELFKTSGGKYVAPQVVENAMKESMYIEQLIVIGDGEKFPAALIVPEFLGLKNWASKEGLDTTDISKLLREEKVLSLFESEIHGLNQRFGTWEQVKSFRLLPRLFTINDGEITPTLKLKRKKIMENWKSLVNDIYKHTD